MGCPPPYRQNLIANLREASQRFRRAYEGLDPAEVAAQPLPGKWSLRGFAEHIALVDLEWTDVFAAAVYPLHPELGRTYRTDWSRDGLELALSSLAGAFAAVERNHDDVIAYLERLPDDRFAHAYPSVSWMVAARVPYVIKDHINWGLVVHLDHHLPFMHRTREALGKGAAWMERGPWARAEQPAA